MSATWGKSFGQAWGPAWGQITGDQVKSAWGKSWGKSWGYSWGKSIGQVPVLIVGGVTTGRPFILPQYDPPIFGRPRKKRQQDILFINH